MATRGAYRRAKGIVALRRQRLKNKRYLMRTRPQRAWAKAQGSPKRRRRYSRPYRSYSSHGHVRRHTVRRVGRPRRYRPRRF